MTTECLACVRYADTPAARASEDGIAGRKSRPARCCTHLQGHRGGGRSSRGSEALPSRFRAASEGEGDGWGREGTCRACRGGRCRT